jgi:hypothetical protein
MQRCVMSVVNMMLIMCSSVGEKKFLHCVLWTYCSPSHHFLSAVSAQDESAQFSVIKTIVAESSEVIIEEVLQLQGNYLMNQLCNAFPDRPATSCVSLNQNASVLIMAAHL